MRPGQEGAEEAETEKRAEKKIITNIKNTAEGEDPQKMSNVDDDGSKSIE